MKGDGKGNFISMTVAESGFFVKGDGKGLATVVTAKGNEMIVATQNQDSLLAFNYRKPAAGRWIQLKRDDFSAEILYKDNTRKVLEFYYGSTYLSQSSRRLFVGNNIAEVTVVSFQGKKRKLF
jgi:hypothetical protein